jgi:hypothetical protein
MNKRKSISKGDLGYIDRHKITQLVITLALLVMVVIIYYTGIIKYDNNKNIYTVLATVSAIPAAKFAVSYIVMFPYKSASKENFERIKKYSKVNILSDLLVSSTEKIINVEFAAIRDNSVFCYVPDEKYEKVYCEKYIRSFLETECKVSTVKVYKDFGQYEKAVANLNNNEQGRYDKRISELMIVYSM